MNIIAKLDKIKHRNLMKNILLSIYKDFNLGTSLVFKGGTAMYFLYGLDRFSTDLDFDLILENTKLSDEQILEKINKILINFGEVKRSFNKRNIRGIPKEEIMPWGTIFSLISYGNIDHNIKIEISKRGISGKYEKINWLSSSLLVMKKESIFTNKLIALLNRTNFANRDIYDIYFFFDNNIDFDIELLEKQVGKNYIEYFKDIIVFLKNIKKSHSILEGLGEVLDKDKKSFVKNNLLNEVIGMFEFRIEFDNK